MNSIVDKAFDLLLLLIIALSFIASGVFIVYQVLEPNANYLIQIGVLIAIAGALSRYYIWIKEQTMRE